MTLYGVLTEKGSAQNPEFNNRYWVDGANMSDALDHAQELSELEEEIFGSTVTFNNLHAWIPGSNPNVFGNRPIGNIGDNVATAPIASFIVARVTWEVENSYPCYKNYRVQVLASNMNGILWASGFQTILNGFAASLGTLTYLRTRTGGLMSNPVADTLYHNQQVGKAWHNRTVPSP